MIERLIESCIRNRFIVLLLAAGLAVLAVYAVLHTPVDAIPDLSENQVIVFTDWMGRSPREIEDQVTYPLSLKLQGLAGVKTIRSASQFNFSMITIIFRDGVNFYFARQRVLEKLDEVRGSSLLPEGVVPRLASDATALGQIFWYTVEPSPGLPVDPARLWALNKYSIVPQLNSAEGVAEVSTVGGAPLEYQIDIKPEALRAYGVTLAEVREAVARSNFAAGGGVVQKNNAEYLVRFAGWLKDKKDIENTVVRRDQRGVPILVKNVAAVQLGQQFRRSVFEKDGSEATGGVVLMRYGENPLEVTQRVKEKIQELQPGLPPGVHIVPAYDRTRLIKGSIHTLTHAMTEEMIIAALAVFLILLHVRSAFVICITLPLSVLFSFLLMALLRTLGVVDIQANIMSLAGITISIGILVDQAIVMTENATHHLKEHFGDRPVTGDTRGLVIPACRTVGRPIFFSVMIMLISFIPVFALSGREGKYFHPLAFTKSFALVGVALLSVTVVPALIPTFLKGRLKREEDNWIVRSFINIYKPVLTWALPRRNLVFWAFAALLIPAAGMFPLEALVGLGASDTAHEVLFLAVLALVTVFTIIFVRGFRWRLASAVSLLLLGLWAFHLPRIGVAFMPALDEGSSLDMPVSVPRASVTEAADDLKARDALLRGFPEVESVIGKAGRADTPTDPAPLEMVETFVNFRPKELWPKRLLKSPDAKRQTQAVLGALEERGFVRRPPHGDDRDSLVAEAVQGALERFDEIMRELASRYYQDFERDLSPVLTRFVMADTVRRFGEAGDLHWPSGVAEEKVIAELAGKLTPVYGPWLAKKPALEDVTGITRETAQHLKRLGALDDPVSALAIKEPPFSGAKLATLIALVVVTVLLAVFALDLPWQAATGAGVILVGLWAGWVGFFTTFFGQAAELLGAERKTFAGEVFQAARVRYTELWREQVNKINWKLFDRGVEAYTWLSLEELAKGAKNQSLLAGAPHGEQMERLADEAVKGQLGKKADPGASTPFVPLRDELTRPFASSVFLWRSQTGSKGSLVDPDLPTLVDDEMGRVLQVPGWINIFTQPIINRIEMLSTGVRTDIGVKVFGPDLQTIDRVCQEIETVLKPRPDVPGSGVAGARDVIATPIMGKGYLEIIPDLQKAARYGVSVGDLKDTVEVALGGQALTQTVEGRERFPVRIRYPRASREDEERVRSLLVNGSGMAGSDMRDEAHQAAPGHGAGKRKPLQVPLGELATVRVVEGPTMLTSENGQLVNYVTLNVRGRDIVGFVDEAQRAVAQKVALPEGVHVAWSGEFEHQVRAAKTLRFILPAVVVLIFIILYLTYKDLADAGLMLLAVPEALAGGAFFQWLFPKVAHGFNWSAPPMDFSVAVWVGYIACFGMATETGIIMLVYLREAIEKRGGLENIQSLEELRQAVIEGAVHRLRPKLLTEGVAILAIAPMLWATGAGAEVIAPMAVPVLGGLLISDEVVDIFLPVRFYWVRRARWLKLQQERKKVARQQTETDLPVVPEVIRPGFGSVAIVSLHHSPQWGHSDVQGEGGPSGPLGPGPGGEGPMPRG
jgi:Cu(I)/Ag(I) efflux system membrane protein CusA/SilA